MTARTVFAVILYAAGVAVLLGAAPGADAQLQRHHKSQHSTNGPTSRIQMSEPTALHQGRRLLKDGKPREALEKYDMFLAAEKLPRYIVTALNGKCAAYINLKEYKNALDTCDEALKISNKRWRVHNNRGTALFYLGRLRDSIKSYHIAQDLAPKADTLKDNIAIAKQRLATLTGGDVNMLDSERRVFE